MLDHTDREGLESAVGANKGFICRAIINIKGLSNTEVSRIKDAANRLQKTPGRINSWLEGNGFAGRYRSSDSIDAQERTSNTNNDGLDSETLQGKPIGGQSIENSQTNRGTGFIKVRDNDGTNGPRYIPINQGKDGSHHFKTSRGEVYGFLDADGNIGLDYNIITAEHPIHEYTPCGTELCSQEIPNCGTGVWA